MDDRIIASLNRNSYAALIEPDAPCRLEVGAWAKYMGVGANHVRSHVRMHLIPTDPDHIGLMLPNPAWHVLWRDKVWDRNIKKYVYVEGIRSGMGFLEIDPRVGSRTTGATVSLTGYNQLPK